MNIQQRCKNGSLIEVEVRCNSLDVDGRDVLAYVTHDVSLRRKAEQQLIENQHRLDRMAHHDQLTGLPNRHYLAAFLPEAIAEAQAAGTMLGVVFLDLDRFKHINDTRGHETGDKLLQEVAARLRTCVRDSDVVISHGRGRVRRRIPQRQIVRRGHPGRGPDRGDLEPDHRHRSAPAADHGQRRGQHVPAGRLEHGRAAEAFGHRHVPGEGPRPQQCADVQPHHEPQAESTASRWRRRCAKRSGSSNWTCTTSRSSICSRAKSSGSRLSCAGTIRCTA